MRKISLFIAMSLDGYIADNKGDVGWLRGQGDDDENIDVYSEFVKDIDTILMGWNTYYQIITKLSPDEWIYDDFTTYVITHRECTSSEFKGSIAYVLDGASEDELVKDVFTKIKEENGKDIWICGGANLVWQLMNEDFIDYYYITVIPTLLGSGIRLFENGKKEIRLKLLNTQSYNGMTDLIYMRE